MSFATHLNPEEALAQIIEQADLIETLAAREGPGGPERQGQIRIAAGRIKDLARVLNGDGARGLMLEDGEAARKAVMESRDKP